MMHESMVRVSIPSELGYEKIVMSTVASLAQKANLSPERIDDLKTATGEAVINAIEHGNQLSPSFSVLTVAFIKDNSLVVNVMDQGLHPMTATNTHPRPQMRQRGWGLYLIRELVDEVTLTTTSTHNELQMVIHLDSPPEPTAKPA